MCEGIVHAEELRELIRTTVRVCSGGDGTGTGKPVQASPADVQQILGELKAIRALLERKL